MPHIVIYLETIEQFKPRSHEEIGQYKHALFCWWQASIKKGLGDIFIALLISCLFYSSCGPLRKTAWFLLQTSFLFLRLEPLNQRIFSELISKGAINSWVPGNDVQLQGQQGHEGTLLVPLLWNKILHFINGWKFLLNITYLFWWA